MRMRCDPCKIRFLKVPWFLGHLVRCPKWKENSSDVIDYFSTLSKKKLVILRRPNAKKKNNNPSPKVMDPAEELIRPPPPTCFTCFCGKSFMSQTRHSAHVQECLAKVMSQTKNPPVTTPATPTTAKHTVVQLDEDHFKVIIQGSDSRDGIQEEQVSFHAVGEGQGGDEVTKDAAEEATEDNLAQEAMQEVEDPLELSTHNRVKVELCEDARVGENVTSADEDTCTQAAVDDHSVTISHEESMEVLEREVMMKTETLANPELNETVLRLEYFEEKLKPDGSHQADVANEIEVGTYEEVAQEFVVDDEEEEEKAVEEKPIRGRLPSIRPPDKTLDIEATVCDCGKKLRSTDDISAHFQVCSVYSKKSPPKTSTSRKTVVLITCVCAGKFTKTYIKEHLLHCATWKYVKQKKNLEGTRGHSDESQSEECYVESDTAEETPSHTESDDLVESEEPRTVSESEDNEQRDDMSQYVIEEIIDAPTIEGNESELQITKIVRIQDCSAPQESCGPNVQEEDASSVTEVDGDHSPVHVHTEVSKITYRCECGALFRHLNVFKVHQTSCSKSLKSRGQVEEVSSTPEPKVAKEDIILKYSAPMQGEVLVNRQCQCGLVIDSICAYRNHTANCLLSQAARKKRHQSKINIKATPKKPPLVAPSQKRASFSKQDEAEDEASESATDSTCALKKSKVELCDELKDFVKLPDKQTPLHMGRRK